MSFTLSGQWKYRSFVPHIVSDAAQGAPDLAAPWAPLGTITWSTSPTGDITGSMQIDDAPFPPATVVAKVTPFSAPPPSPGNLALQKIIATVDLTITATIPTAPAPFTYKIKAYASVGTTNLVGSTLALDRDIAGRPAGSIGACILFPI